MNKKLLKSKMALNGDNNRTIAEKIGITPASFSNKLNSKREFTRDEMIKIRNIYGLSNMEFLLIFFVPFVDKTEQKKI